MIILFILVFSFGFLNIVFGVFNFNCSFCFCFVCEWEKVNPSFMCWAIVQTKTHATCEWDHLWNNGLQIKPTSIPKLVRIFFQVAHSIKHSVWVHPPHVMHKLKRDENLVDLIWTSKVFCAKDFTDVWDSQNWRWMYVKISTCKKFEFYLYRNKVTKIHI